VCARCAGVHEHAVSLNRKTQYPAKVAAEADKVLAELVKLVLHAADRRITVAQSFAHFDPHDKVK